MTSQTTTAPRTSTPPPTDRRGGGRSTKPMVGNRSALLLFLGYAVLVFFSFIYLYPFLVQLTTSFKTNTDAVANPLSLVPDPFTTAAFRELAQRDFPLWFGNSVLVTVLVTAGRVFLCSLAGYALARIKFRGRGAVFTAILAVMAVPGVILLIPKFLVLNYLGIYNTYPALVLPLLVDAAGVFIMKQFFESIPESVEEAARIDGAGTFRIFWSVVLPMARPALITITILSFQGSWNELPHFIVASQDQDLFTLTKGVATLTSGQLGSGSQYPITMAAALLMTIPVAIVFFLFQKHLVRGGTSGAVKG
ncbi:MAG TPA: carbohydrate ABC transporter permease [Nocardioides sp.]|nr:carbohydrate ABC transporter permease [Nocardioides sp.]